MSLPLKFFLFLIIASFLACTENQPDTQRECLIQTPYNTLSKVIENRSIDIEVTVTPALDDHLDLILSIGGNELHRFGNEPYLFTWGTEGRSLGRHTIVASIIDQTEILASDEIEVEIIPYKPVTQMTDSRDGTVYKLVEIGNQVWMSENLRLDNEYGEPATNSSDPENQFGYLYDTRYGREQGACPTEYHIPSRDDWNELIEYLGGEEVAGGKLKSTGTSIWEAPNLGATNSSGFNALPAGGLTSYGITAEAFGKSARFFTDHYGAYIFLDHDSEAAKTVLYHPAVEYYSIRCIRDY